MAFTPPDLQALEGEPIEIHVRAANLGVPLKPVLKVLDEEGRDISATVPMPSVNPVVDDESAVTIRWTTPFWPRHESRRVSILVSQPPLQEKFWLGIDDCNRPPEPRSDTPLPVTLLEGAAPTTIKLTPFDPDEDEVTLEITKVDEGVTASLSETDLSLSVDDRAGVQGDEELSVTILARDEEGDESEFVVPIMVKDVDHDIVVDWDLGRSSFTVTPPPSQGAPILLRGTGNPGLSALVSVKDPDRPKAVLSLAIAESSNSELSLKPSGEGRWRLTWRGPRREAWGPRALTLTASGQDDEPTPVALLIQCVRRVQPPANPGRDPLDRALDWLRRHQLDDGSLATTDQDFRRFSDDERDWGAGRKQHREGLTALAVIAALRAGDASPWVGRAAAFLLSRQQDSGRIGADGTSMLYNHALSTEALVLAHHLLGDAPFKAAATRAVGFLQSARQPHPNGGWRYAIRPERSDTSITVWAVRALLAAKMAGLPVDEDALQGGLRFIESMWSDEGQIGYVATSRPPSRPERLDRTFLPSLSESMTAAGLSVLLQSELVRPQDPRVARAGRLVVGCPPAWGFRSRGGQSLAKKLTPGQRRRMDALKTPDFYYWQHATAMFRSWRMVRKKVIHRSSDWKSFVSLLASKQRKSGDARGSWDPKDPWSEDGGRTYSTATLALALANLTFMEPLVGE